MAKTPHYVRDYNELVRRLLDQHPLDQAMSLAVGGQYETMGAAEAEVLKRSGLARGHTVIDIGCGSGRLTKQLSNQFGSEISYLGVDVVPELLDYAARGCPSSYRFLLTKGITIPAQKSSTDFVVAFSVFTHLRISETFSYIQDARRVLKPGGRLIFSFLEPQSDWRFFWEVMAQRWRAAGNHRISFAISGLIRALARGSGLCLERIGHREIGQSVAVLRRQ